jgi:hypothetical protein
MVVPPENWILPTGLSPAGQSKGFLFEKHLITRNQKNQQNIQNNSELFSCFYQINSLLHHPIAPAAHQSGKVSFLPSKPCARCIRADLQILL